MRYALRVLLAMAMALSGCGRADPSRGRLAVGSQAIVAKGPLPEAVRLIDPDRGEDIAQVYVLAPGKSPMDGYVLPLGTRVRVVSDEEGLTGEDRPTRSVTINVLEGEHTGKAGSISRNDLRPISSR